MTSFQATPTRPPPRPAVPVAIVSDDAAFAAELRAQLLTAAELWLVDEPERAAVLVWDPPRALLERADTIPELPGGGDAGPDGGPAAVLALVDEDLDPMPLLAAGVRGLLARDVGGDRLRAAILAAELGLSVIDEDPIDAVVANWSPDDFSEDGRSSTPPPARRSRLTPREHEVLGLLADGLSNRAIAEVLGISPHTVKFHVDALLDKLAARSRTQAVVQAVRSGLLELV